MRAAASRPSTKDTAAIWLDAVRAAIQTQADAVNLPTREFACTLVAALVGDASAAFLQVGDGAIVTASASAASEVVFWPEQGEYTNTTYFVTGADAHQRLRLDVRTTPVHDVALFTDGLQHIALRYETRLPHQPFFDPMFARLRADEQWPGLGGALASFLGSEAISTRTDDDCTLVLACRCEALGAAGGSRVRRRRRARGCSSGLSWAAAVKAPSSICRARRSRRRSTIGPPNRPRPPSSRRWSVCAPRR